MMVMREFNDWEKKNGSIGARVEDPFLPDECRDIVDQENIGKKCEIYYNKNGYIVHVSIHD